MARAKKERAKYVAVIESLDQEGRGVARRDGKVVFIEGALPGEKIEYEVYRSKPSFELGLTTEIYKESPLRVLPKCPYFGVKDGSCGGCAAGKGCVFGGVVNEAIEKAKTADAFVFGTPVHYASASGNMTSFMDRLAYAGGKYLAYKPAAICCSARRAGTTSTLDQLVKYPQFFHMPLVNGSYWAMVHGSNPEQVLQDAEGCAVMQELGRNMAWLLHCIQAGKAAGIEHPQNPKRPMTNFIR